MSAVAVEPAPPAPIIGRADMRHLIALASRRAGWRPLEALLRQYAPGSAEVTTYLARVIGSKDCPVCGTTFITSSWRVRYCSDRCRRVGAERHLGIVTPAAPVHRCVLCNVRTYPHPGAEKLSGLCCRVCFRELERRAVALRRKERDGRCRTCGGLLTAEWQRYFCGRHCAMDGTVADVRRVLDELRRERATA